MKPPRHHRLVPARLRSRCPPLTSCHIPVPTRDSGHLPPSHPGVPFWARVFAIQRGFSLLKENSGSAGRATAPRPDVGTDPTPGFLDPSDSIPGTMGRTVSPGGPGASGLSGLSDPGQIFTSLIQGSCTSHMTASNHPWLSAPAGIKVMWEL